MSKGLSFLREAIVGRPNDDVAVDEDRRTAPQALDAPDGRARAVVDAVLPAVAGGCVTIEAHVFTDGHDVPRVMLQWWKEGSTRREELPMKLRNNDEWHASFVAPAPGRYRYTVLAWVDAFESWHHEMQRRVEPQDIRIAVRVGAQ